MLTASRNQVLLLALGLASATTFVTYQFLKTAVQLPLPRREPVAQVRTVVVPVAEVAPLRPLRAWMFTPRRLPLAGVPQDAVAAPSELEGKVSLAPLPAGEPVRRAAVTLRGPQLGLAFAVRPPRRAVTVALDPVIGVAGFPKPGNRVDVLATFSTDAGMVTGTVLEDVEILALGSELPAPPVEVGTGPSSAGRAKPEPAGSGKTAEAKPQPTATLAVLSTEAERLVLAESRGKLRLALRAVDDTAPAKPRQVTEVMLTGVPAARKDATVLAIAKRSAASAPLIAKNGKAGSQSSDPAHATPALHHVLVVRGSQQEVVQVGRGAARGGTARRVGLGPEGVVDRAAILPGSGPAPAAETAGAESKTADALAAPPVGSDHPAPLALTAPANPAAPPAGKGGIR